MGAEWGGVASEAEDASVAEVVRRDALTGPAQARGVTTKPLS